MQNKVNQKPCEPRVKELAQKDLAASGYLAKEPQHLTSRHTTIPKVSHRDSLLLCPPYNNTSSIDLSACPISLLLSYLRTHIKPPP